MYVYFGSITSNGHTHSSISSSFAISSDTFHQLLDNDSIEDITDDMQLDAGFGD